MAKRYTIKVKGISFTKLNKLEVYTFFNEIVDVISGFDITAMRIDNTCSVLIGLIPKSELLKISDRDLRSHMLTPVVTDFHEQRNKFAAIITNQIKIAEKAGFANKAHLLELVKPVVLRHLNYLSEKDRVAVTQTVIDFFNELKDNPKLQEALYQLGFKPYLDELELAQKNYLDTYDKRRGQISRRHKGSTLPLQRELQNMLSILFNQVDYYQHIHLDVDYTGLITALNVSIATYTKLIKTRDTKSKNKKLKAKETEQAALEEKIKTDKAEQTQKYNTDTTSATSKPTDWKEKQTDDKPSATAKNIKGKDKPINGLMNILKKPDRGENDEGAKDK